MRLHLDKPLSCPYCIRPLALQEYEPHLVGECERKAAELLTDRLLRYAGLRLPNNDEELVTEYLALTQFCTAFYPPHWTAFAGSEDAAGINTTFHVVPEASAEFQGIADLVQSTAGGPTRLLRVERVQNRELYMRYLDAKSGANGGREALLFHGSRPHLYNIICNQGFDMGHSRNGLHGYGLYFSSTMSYSKGYTNKGSSMLLCRVWLTADSIVSGNIHVVHSDFSAHPEYVLYYE